MYTTTIGFHNGDFEVEVVICDTSLTKEEADKVGETSLFDHAILLESALVLEGGGKFKAFPKDRMMDYQFRLCENRAQIHAENRVVEDSDYKHISWNEALAYLKRTFPGREVFELEPYYHGVYEGEFQANPQHS